jgi:uncharacterized protein
MANPFVHVELTTPDTGKAKSFYSALFDWKLEDVEMGPNFTYTMIRVGEGTGGGMMKTPAPGVPTSWLPYVLVDNVSAGRAFARPLLNSGSTREPSHCVTEPRARPPGMRHEQPLPTQDSL